MNEVRPSKQEDPSLPDEVVHITANFIPLSRILTRLAQVTHNALQDKIVELGQMPLPPPDGGSSPDNLAKKLALLNFAHDSHTKWVKALVIADWSRKVSKVRKIIDLNNYLYQKKELYRVAIETLINNKAQLSFARLPSPDFKTALQVLSTGQGSWMPDVNYIEAPALSREDQLKWIGDLNTLLTLRLNLEDFESIPPAFRDYEIDSGRVTFKVAGEFEVDLTIADEDVSKQFWFIDFRFACNPAAANLPDSLRSYLESCVNEALREEGLMGCYQFLHEFVLTYKIHELKRQTLLLNRGFWTGNLKVEPLHRAFAIQYWINQGQSGSPKNWVLIAVESGKSDGSSTKPSSKLVAKWYRDNKEVLGGALILDEENLSAEVLLRDVVSLHIEHLLTTTYDKISATARFQKKETALSLRISKADPSASSLAMQVNHNSEVALLIEPATGSFSVKPHCRLTLQHEHQLNSSSRQAQDGANCLEAMRCALIEDEIHRKGSQAGWAVKKAPMTAEKLRSATGLRDWTRTICLQRDGWDQHWYIVVFLSVGGDAWWLIEGDQDDANRLSRFHAMLPLKNGPLKMSDAFWDDLTLCATGMIAQSIDLADLHRAGIKSRITEEASWSLTQSITLPAVEIALSAIFPSMVANGTRQASPRFEHPDAEALRVFLQPSAALFTQANQPWASDLVTVRFRGLEAAQLASTEQSTNEAAKELLRVSDAIIHVEKPSRFAALELTTDKDVEFRPKIGEFRLQLQHAIGQPILQVLRTRIKTVDRFVNFLEAVEHSKGDISRGKVSLKDVSCTYPDSSSEDASDGDEPTRRWELGLHLASEEITVVLQKDNPHLRVVDLLQKLVNTDGGIWSLMTWLPVSIDAMHAIRDIEARWSDIQAAGQGHVRIFPKTLDWLSMAFTVSPSGRGPKTATFDLRVKSRRGRAVWHIERLDANPGKDDPFGAALQSVWAGQGKNWLGLKTSAAGEPEGGVATMLNAVDEAIRELLNTSAARPPMKTQKSSDVVVLD